MVKQTLTVNRFFLNLKRDRYLWLLVIPCIAYFIIFQYIPMGGLVIAFKDFRPIRGIWGSAWVGLRNFTDFFSSPFFYRLLRNTLLLNFYGVLWGFPVPIIFALLVNELRQGLFKRAAQTISYLPHFISIVVLVGMIHSLLSPYEGIVNIMIKRFGGEPIVFLSYSKYFRTIYVASGIWQSFGFNSIIYLSAIAAVDPQMYEAAKIDGATRFQIMSRITFPSILPTVIILLILRTGQMMNVGFEKVNLLYQPATYETADVISTYVYRRGIIGTEFSFATAVGFFNSVVNFVLIVAVNAFSKRISEVSLW